MWGQSTAACVGGMTELVPNNRSSELMILGRWPLLKESRAFILVRLMPYSELAIIPVKSHLPDQLYGGLVMMMMSRRDADTHLKLP